MSLPRFRRRGCSTCTAPVSPLLAVHSHGRRYCCRACAAQGRLATEKARHDLADGRVICRCPGVPRPLEATGRHCVRCRRLFSSGVLQLLADHRRAEQRPITRLLHRFEALALRPVHLPRLG